MQWRLGIYQYITSKTCNVNLKPKNNYISGNSFEEWTQTYDSKFQNRGVFECKHKLCISEALLNATQRNYLYFALLIFMGE